MSVHLIVIRVEIEDGHPILDSLKFNSECEMDESKFSPNIITNDNVKLTDEEVANIKVCQGKRKSSDIEITSYSKGDDSSHVQESSSLPTKTMHFFFGNPTVECTQGILHLYKETQLTSIDLNSPRSNILAMIAVPAKLEWTDLQQFLAPAQDAIYHIKIIRDATPNQYMVILTFSNQMEADSFYKQFSGRQYNSLESEICHLVYVARVESMLASEGASFPVAGLIEVPKCPVCLEKMDDSVEAVLTILCDHSFHAACLGRWEDSTCPVCRYTQTPSPTTDQQCFECDSKESLWICLICGYIGCGRYQGRHAYEHFKFTAHTFSMELESQRVWDYAGDNYVHRLIQSKTDGKMVQLDGRNECVDDEKIESLTLEYSYLLTNQLESQRLYFEEKMMALEKDSISKIAAVEERLRSTMEDYRSVQDDLGASQKDKKQLEKKYTQVVGRVSGVCLELKEERQLNSCLRENQAVWQEKVDTLSSKFDELKSSKDKEVGELREEIHDLMKHLEMQTVIAGSEDGVRKDIQGGNLMPMESPSPSETSRHRSRTKKK